MTDLEFFFLKNFVLWLLRKLSEVFHRSLDTENRMASLDVCKKRNKISFLNQIYGGQSSKKYTLHLLR